VKFLLDVSALIAWHHGRAPKHRGFHAWAAKEHFDEFATCAHTELGFIRVSMQAFGHSLVEAETALVEVRKATGGFIETAPPPKLSVWATKAAHTSDAYLVQVAASAGLKLATFDTGIPGATLIR